jgi:uncharacterized membrane protein YfcA
MIVALTIAALVTSIISGILGMGGGILLLATLLSFLPHGQAIPVHAGVQIVSNSTRALALLRHVDWGVVGRFTTGAVPGMAAGYLLLRWLGQPDASEPYLKMLVGIYVLGAAFWPAGEKARESGAARREFGRMGFVAGVAALTVGAVGPLIAPLFARHDYVKERLVATKAMCQMVTHVCKLPAFYLLETIPAGLFLQLMVVMSAAAIVGTLIGRQLLKRVSETMFRRAYRVLLVLTGAKVLLVDGILKIMEVN